MVERYTVNWNQYETISSGAEDDGAEKLVTEDTIKISGTDEVHQAVEEDIKSVESDKTMQETNVSEDNTAEDLSGQVMETDAGTDDVKAQDAGQPEDPGDLTELFAVDDDSGGDAEENEELLQRYYEKLMKEEEQNRQFEAYEQDREQPPLQGSLFDSDADTGCFDLSLDGFGLTDG